MDWGIAVYCGSRGCGKTYRICEQVTRLVSRHREVIAFDPTGDIYKELSERYAHRSEPMVRKFESTAEMLANKGKARVACVCPPRMELCEREAKAFQVMMLRTGREGLVYVCDEGEVVFNEWGKGLVALPVVIMCRNFKLLIIVAAKDPIRLSVDIRRGKTVAFIYSQPTTAAVKALRDISDSPVLEGSKGMPFYQCYYIGQTTSENPLPAPVLLTRNDPLPDEL
jgi:hypothetical protein